MSSTDHIDTATKLIQSARFEEAEAFLKAMPGVNNNARAQQLIGIAALQTNRAAEAILCFENAAHELTEDCYLQNNLGLAYRSLGDRCRAKIAFRKAAEFHLGFADPLNYLGLLYRQEGNLEEAEKAFSSAIARRPGYAEAYFNLGALVQDQGRLNEASEFYLLAIETKPLYVQAINNLGTVQDALGDYDAAEQTFRLGLVSWPETPELYSGLASCLCQQAKYSEACTEYLKAIGIAPNSAELVWNLGFLQLAMSDYAEGWANYRYRHSVDRSKFPLPMERLAEDLLGQEIDLAAEQGLGDEIFFLRFSADLIRRGATVKFQPDPRIKTLVERVEGIRIGNVKKTAFSIADLPYLLGNETAVPSIHIPADEKIKTAMQARLAAVGPAPYIGVTYRAGGAGKDTLIKNVPLDGIGVALNGISATIINVQRFPEAGEQAEISKWIGQDIADFSDINDNLEDALALMALLDDYVSVSNTNIHLRVATGRPARILVTHPGEYRWQVEGAISPWFPGFELYRQDVDGAWASAFASLRSDMKAKYE